jgi:hypothetical protein
MKVITGFPQAFRVTLLNVELTTDPIKGIILAVSNKQG